MESHKLLLKLYIDNPSAIGHEEFVPVFHSWIQQHLVPGHLLIDVADYKHVPEGPGTVLVAHDALISIDHSEGRPGFMYVRKQPIPDADTFPDRLRAVFRATLEGCLRLEEDPRLSGRLRFRTDELVFRVNDRLYAPNTPATFDAVKPDLETLAAELYVGLPVTLEHRPSAGGLFEVRIKSPQSPPVESLLGGLPVARGA